MGIGRGQRPHDLEHRGQKIDVDHLPHAGAFGMAQRRHHRKRPGQCRHLVGQGNRRQQRRATRLAHQVGQAAQRLGNRGETGMQGIGAVLAETADLQDDQRRIARQQIVRREPERGKLARSHVLDQHIRAVQQGAELRLAGVGLQVHHHRPLVAVDQFPEIAVGLILADPAHPPGRIPRRGLDLDHVGAVVGQIAGNPRCRDHGRQFDHPNPCQRRGHGVGPVTGRHGSRTARVKVQTRRRS